MTACCAASRSCCDLLLAHEDEAARSRSSLRTSTQSRSAEHGDEEDDDWEWKDIASHEPPSLADFTVADQLRMGAAPRRSWVPPRGRKGEKPLEPKVKVTSMLYPHMVKYQ